MGKGGGSQTVRQEMDPVTREQTRYQYGVARAASQQPHVAYPGQTVAGVSSLSPEATERYRQAANFGMQGMGAMAGDPTMVAQMMNPYLSTMNPVYDDLRARATNQANEDAMRAGAFGGSRHGVMAGERVGNVDRAQAEMNMNAYNEAMQRAGQLAQFGMAGNAAQMASGDYYRNIQQQQLDDQYRRFLEARDWDVRNLGILQGTPYGPYGTTQTTQMPRNALASGLGGASQGAAIGSMIMPGPGTIIGGGIGLLGGLFG